MSRFKAGEYVIRTGADYSHVKQGGVYVVVNEAGEGVKVMTLGGRQFTPRFAPEKFRLATHDEERAARIAFITEVDRLAEAKRIAERALRPTDPAFDRDGLPRDLALALDARLRAGPVALPPQPSVRYALRKNPPVRKPTVHPVPVGWKYSATPGQGGEVLDIIVRSRPADWNPLDHAPLPWPKPPIYC